MNIIVLVIFTLIAAVSDIKRRKITNKLIIYMIVIGVISRFIENQMTGIMEFGLRFIITIVVLLMPFAYKLLGAGDVKLIASIAGYVGVKGIIAISVYFSVAGAIYAALILIQAKFRQSELNDSKGIPYAVPIFVGVCLYAFTGELII